MNIFVGIRFDIIAGIICGICLNTITGVINSICMNIFVGIRFDIIAGVVYSVSINIFIGHFIRIVRIIRLIVFRQTLSDHTYKHACKDDDKEEHNYNDNDADC